MDSPSHKANILDPDFSFVGVGVMREHTTGAIYVTQIFLGLPPASRKTLTTNPSQQELLEVQPRLSERRITAYRELVEKVSTGVGVGQAETSSDSRFFGWVRFGQKPAPERRSFLAALVVVLLMGLSVSLFYASRRTKRAWPSLRQGRLASQRARRKDTPISAVIKWKATTRR